MLPCTVVFFDLAAHSCSREVHGTCVRGLNAGSRVAVSNVLSFGCSEVAVPEPATLGRNYVVISVNVHSR